MIADLDRAFFSALETAGTAVTLDEGVVAIEDVVEAMVQSISTVTNDYIDGVDREMIVLTFNPTAYGKLRNHIDKVLVVNDAGEEEVAMFHGVRAFENTRQTSAIIATVFGSAAQPVLVNEYADEKVNLSNAHAVELFYSYGTGVVTPDLVKKLATLPA